MGIVGGHPESGVRIVVERPATGGPPWCYEGTALTSSQRFELRATVSATGEVSVELGPSLGGDPQTPRDTPADLRLRVKTMIRTAHKHARDESPGAPPPRQIHRWRGSSGAG
jgi:hypothetical protein